ARLSVTTSHPKELSPELIKLFGKLPPLCENLHLPVQSGSDNILKSMGRIYTRRQYLELVEQLRHNCPDISLTTDIIVGFPGETEFDFEQTISLLETATFDSIFSFKYSDRPQTKSITFSNKVSDEEMGRRLTYLQNFQKKITLARNQRHIGETIEVLVEKESSRYLGELTGRGRNGKLIHFEGPPHLLGQLAPVRITEAWGASLRGVLN
ncbi:MAG: radical SAM protein, partial [Candidatus Adiutrix sp.]